ncbi:MAG: hypothetical protein COU35_05135 [Candidatus Magasanikbacteria bacterium CG10_big_fil_rev_8_21_14_0_10_47_10]|uniref:Uncharacterized protein n=1 Tax=Candidatus Magasanikbacteria bacterium CG10_big_fil_rev_8_21_14_0_10_47_10 TaxID=1974652 RepID=A0A2H0TP72_9BACT|nr:MAG: hypothetical protein COU35_05135 [Candidatus Magasanikbacteria bacterium CG10_big_fil_rev_8_21_14_0_10_47_10]
MTSNFSWAIISISADLKFFFTNVLGSINIVSFLFGFLISVLVIGFIITGNPRYLPIVLRYSLFDSFNKIATCDKTGVFQEPYSKFVKVYTRIRFFFLSTIILFVAIVISIVVLYGFGEISVR